MLSLFICTKNIIHTKIKMAINTQPKNKGKPDGFITFSSSHFGFFKRDTLRINGTNEETTIAIIKY